MGLVLRPMPTFLKLDAGYDSFGSRSGVSVIVVMGLRMEKISAMPALFGNIAALDACYEGS